MIKTMFVVEGRAVVIICTDFNMFFHIGLANAKFHTSEGKSPCSDTGQGLHHQGAALWKERTWILGTASCVGASSVTWQQWWATASWAALTLAETTSADK